LVSVTSACLTFLHSSFDTMNFELMKALFNNYKMYAYVPDEG
jgi:hypothetical protein